MTAHSRKGASRTRSTRRAHSLGVLPIGANRFSPFSEAVRRLHAAHNGV
jgi:hypothetical protein